jgi:outer membrane protein assembly factor BamB
MTRKLIGMLTRFHFAALILVAAFVSVGGYVTAAPTDSALNGRVHVIEDYKTPGIEAELSGIYPHPTDAKLYYVLTNAKPPYRYGQKPMLAPEFRGKLLTVEKSTGRIVGAVKIADDDFGGLVFAEGNLYAATTRGAEILKLDPKTFAVLARFRLPSPAGGLGYDKERGVLIAQLYVGYPHLAVVDLKTGAIKGSLWSDESAMGLAKVDGDYLCTWASGWDAGSFSELRILDQATGRVKERMKLDGVHTAIAPDRGSNGEPAFISVMTVNSQTGATIIRKFAYARQTTAQR